MEQLQSLLGVTGFYAGILGLLFVLLSVRVSQARQRLAIGIGDGGNPEMTCVIQVHANFAEYGPMALILLAVIEINGASIWLLHVLGVALVAIRAGHAWGLGVGALAPRVLASGGMYFYLAVTAIYAIYQFATQS